MSSRLSRAERNALRELGWSTWRKRAPRPRPVKSRDILSVGDDADGLVTELEAEL